MAIDDVNTGGTREKQSFRRLIRFSISAQVTVIVVIVAFAIWGALQTTDRSNDLKQASGNVLLMQGLTQEFDRSRASLRQYVASGDAFVLGPFTQSRRQLTVISNVLFANLDQPTLTRAREYNQALQSYLVDIGDNAVAAVKRGDRGEAREILVSPEAAKQFDTVLTNGSTLRDELAVAQVEADRAVARRQAINVALILVAALIMLGSGLGVLFWIRRKMMVPLENLAVASRKLGHGDLSARVDPGGVQEIALTGSAFNQMADEIEQHVGQMHDLSAARSRFVSSVSHELRTPITSLRGYLELLENGEAGPLEPDQARYVEIAGRNARQLDDLINDLLTMSRVQSGKITVKPEPVNVRELLRDLKAEMLPIGAERGVDVVLVDTGDLIVSGDPLRLKQAFGNLLSNSIKYSRDGQAVIVRAFAVNRQAVISFVDWGVGIPREDLPQIAEPFFRSNSSDRIPGTGLGLAIAKQMVELHGGRLAVESEFGSGSTFTVYLPLQGTAGDVPPNDGQPDGARPDNARPDDALGSADAAQVSEGFQEPEASKPVER
ncbi:MAG: sensor histidine kinase [Solirubrobacterales bacterium]